MRLIKTIAIIGLIAAPITAQAQWVNTPSPFGPQFGSEWKGPDGQRVTVRPSPFGGDRTIIKDQDGNQVTCQLSPFGNRTTCR